MIDFAQLIALFESLVQLTNSLVGTNMPKSWATPIAFFVTAPVVGVGLYAGIRKIPVIIRRLSGEKKALDSDGRAVVENIKGDLEKLKGEIRRASRSKSNQELQPLLQILIDRIDKAEDLVTGSSEEETREEKLDRNGRMPRRLMVQLVRETVLSNLWAGNYFDETRRRRHVYRATFEDAERKWISITVRTPFALPPQSDDELPYGIDVRHENRYVMRIQWDPFKHDDLKIQYVIRGSWEDAVLSWNVSQQYIPKIPNSDTGEELAVEVADMAKRYASGELDPKTA